MNIEHGEVEWTEFMWVRVNLDISKPLARKKKLNIELTKPIWVTFTYERLSDFCFSCGLLGHTYKECEIWEEVKVKFEADHFPYGIWLRAGPPDGGVLAQKQCCPIAKGREVTAATDRDAAVRSPTKVKAQSPKPVPNF